MTSNNDGNASEKTPALRPKTSHDVGVSLYPSASQDGLIITMEPPSEPADRNLAHIPCDIVLVIDVSGTMGVDAPVPTNPGEEIEPSGLSVLDLVKHAARTIVETLNENDRLGIVTFASQAKVGSPPRRAVYRLLCNVSDGVLFPLLRY